MTASNILYVGLVNYDNDHSAIGRYRICMNNKSMTGFADDVIPVALQEGQRPSEAVDEFIQKYKPQYRTGWRKSIFPTFVAVKEPTYETFETCRPTRDGRFKPLGQHDNEVDTTS